MRTERNGNVQSGVLWGLGQTHCGIELNMSQLIPYKHNYALLNRRFDTTWFYTHECFVCIRLRDHELDIYTPFVQHNLL